MFIRDIEPKKTDGVPSNLFFKNGSIDAIPKSKETLKLFIEEPCLKACEYLFDCNICTTDSSANKKNINNQHAYIQFDYSSLDEENKKIISKLENEGSVINLGEPSRISDGPFKGIEYIIQIPLNKDSTVEEVEEKFLKIAKNFKKQELLYGSIPRESLSKYCIKVMKYLIMT